MDDPQHLDPFWVATVNEAVLPNDQFSNRRIVILGYPATSFGEDTEQPSSSHEFAHNGRGVKLGITADILRNGYKIVAGQARPDYLPIHRATRCSTSSWGSVRPSPISRNPAGEEQAESEEPAAPKRCHHRSVCTNPADKRAHKVRDQCNDQRCNHETGGKDGLNHAVGRHAHTEEPHKEADGHSAACRHNGMRRMSHPDSLVGGVPEHLNDQLNQHAHRCCAVDRSVRPSSCVGLCAICIFVPCDSAISQAVTPLRDRQLQPRACSCTPRGTPRSGLGSEEVAGSPST
jgi:hypothetical protein